MLLQGMMHCSFCTVLWFFSRIFCESTSFLQFSSPQDITQCLKNNKEQKHPISRVAGLIPLLAGINCDLLSSSHRLIYRQQFGERFDCLVMIVDLKTSFKRLRQVNFMTPEMFGQGTIFCPKNYVSVARVTHSCRELELTQKFQKCQSHFFREFDVFQYCGCYQFAFRI